jgi:hypothetical protein
LTNEINLGGKMLSIYIYLVNITIRLLVASYGVNE